MKVGRNEDPQQIYDGRRHERSFFRRQLEPKKAAICPWGFCPGTAVCTLGQHEGATCRPKSDPDETHVSSEEAGTGKKQLPTTRLLEKVEQV